MSDSVTINPSVQVDVTVDRVECGACGSALSYDLSTNGRDELLVTVDPCQSCLASEAENARATAP